MDAFDAACITIGAGHCPLLVGIPGVAKSRFMDALARAMGLVEARKRTAAERIAHFNERMYVAYMKTLFASSREGVDYHGYPVPPKGSGEGVRIEAPYWAMKMHNIFRDEPWARAMLFLDELNTGGDDVQKACLSIIDEHRVGDLEPFDALPNGMPRLIVVAAQNPIELATGGSALMPALITRVVKIDWHLPVGQWIEAARAGFPDPQPIVVPDNWKSFIPVERNYILSYLDRKHKSALDLAGDLDEQKNNKKSKIDTSEPHANYRTWTKAWEVLAAANSVGATDVVKFQLLAGCVGPGHADEFNSWRRNLDLPDPRDILAGRVKLQIDKLGARLDRAATVLNGVADVAAEEATKPRGLANTDMMRRFWETMQMAWEHPQTHDIVVTAVRGNGLRVHKLGYPMPVELAEAMADTVSKAASASR